MHHEEPLQVIYLGLYGVLCPARSLFNLCDTSSPWDDDTESYAGAPVFEELLQGWPDARIVLASNAPWAQGLPSVLTRLGPGLSARVMGYTYDDLTTKVSVGPRRGPMGSADYWRHLRAEIVRLHVAWLKPSAWVAVDAETILWTAEERERHLVAVDADKTILDPAAQDRLLTVLRGNFGKPKIGPT